MTLQETPCAVVVTDTQDILFAGRYDECIGWMEQRSPDEIDGFDLCRADYEGNGLYTLGACMSFTLWGGRAVPDDCIVTR